MGCSGSKSAQATEPGASQDPGTSQDPGACQDPQQESKEEVFVTVDEATVYVQHELKVSEDRAKKIVAKVNKTEDGKIAESELVALWNEIQNKVNDMRGLFSELDKDNSGFVTIDEGEGALKKTFPDLTSDQIKVMLKRFDTNDSGKLSYHEFVYFYATLSSRKEYLIEKLNELDKDKTGSLTADEVTSVLVEECVLVEEEARSLVDDFDVNNDGKLKRDELEALIKKLFP